MGLDVVDLRRCQVGGGQHRADQRLLGGTVRYGLAAARAVLIDPGTADDRADPVAVAHRVGEALEHHHAATLASHIAVGVGVEGLAGAVGGQHAPPGTGDAVLRAQVQIHPTGQRTVDLTAPQPLTREMDRHQRRGARCVRDDRRAVEAEEIRQAARGEVGGVAERDVRVESRPRDRTRERQGVVVGGHPHVHAGGRSAQPFTREAGVLDALPGDLHQQPLLGVHPDRFARGESEELGIELVGVPVGEETTHPVHDGARDRVVLGVELVGVPTVLGHPHHTAAALGQQIPVVARIVDVAG